MAGIAIRGLSKHFGAGDGRIAAVDEMSLDIPDNEIVAVLGPAGSGKTTLLRLIAGYLRPDAGTIHLDGELLSSPEHIVPVESRAMGMVQQQKSLWPHRTVFENVAFGLRVRGVAVEEADHRVNQMLARVRMAGSGEQFPEELTPEQQQRVALARSLIVEPKVLLLDEPLGDLDGRARQYLRAEMRQIQRRTGVTFVYATSDQTEALALSDHVAVIEAGRLQQFGTPQDVYSHPLNRTVADIMGLVNILSGRVTEVRASIARIDTGPDLKLEMTVPDGIGMGDQLEVLVRPENIRLTRLQPPAFNGAAARITDMTFLGNMNEYFVTLTSGRVMRAQAHPIQRFAIGDNVAIEIDVGRCSVLRHFAGQAHAAE
jgi:ABC-type Fe3+/spermidine/putrescine transport system ATPase subunit